MNTLPDQAIYGAAVVAFATIVGLAYVVAADVRGRAAATTAQLEQRGAVTVAWLETIRALTPPPQSVGTPVPENQVIHLDLVLPAQRGEG